jgi:NAD(P)-dependent dehydrogenase (short-subunit alcohol dehydrogenase family)
MRSVIITGANRGIGLEISLAFARAGYKVFATMRNPSNAVSLKQKIKEESLSISIWAMDVNSDESVKQCVESILRENGVVDVLVNNAGVERHGSVEELTMDDFRDVMETNFFGVLRCTKALLPSMRQNRKGCIINLASVSGKIATSPLGAYCASKYALEAMSEALAQEVKSFNIRVAIIEPGIISTDMATDISISDDCIYPQTKRFAGLFAASLQTPRPPAMVADKILEIAETDTWQLRHPVGPDALPFLQWRASMTDEQYVDWNAATDDEWYDGIQNTFGLNARQV